MKNRVKFRWVIAILAMIVFQTGCSDGGGTTPLPIISSAVINIKVIGGVTAPVTGATPVTTITGNDQYTGTIKYLPNDLTFAAATQYTATITLTAKSGYTLQGVKADFFSVVGAISVSNAANSGVITAVFPKTAGTEEEPAVIDIAAIDGITPPVIGEIPVTAITENEQYSGTVTWNDNPYTFAASTVYMATITLTPKTGYTLQGVNVDFFTVEGAASVSNNADSGVVIAVFPATAATVITSVSITITAPVKGAAPGTTASGTGNFDIGAVSWLPANNPFQGGVVYTASVTLTANNSYTFTGLSSVVINGQNATVTNNNGSTVTLSYTFSATSTKTVSSIAIKTPPNKLTYTYGDTLDLTGLVLTLTHDDTTTEDVSAADFTAKNITANPAQGNSLSHSTHNGTPVTITYGDLTPLTTNNLIVNPKVITFTVDTIPAYTYTGSAFTPAVIVKDGSTTLTYNTDYTVSYSSNTNAGTATVTISGAGNYSGSTGSRTFTINRAAVTAADFDISGTGTFNNDGSVRTVTVTPKAGKSTGTATVKYNGSTTAPSAAGTYTVTFDVAETANFNAASGLTAGTLAINAIPIAADYIISSNLTQIVGSVTAVTITPNSGKSGGTRTVYYEGTGGTTYTKSTALPTAVGTYTVTFDVAAADGFDAASGLSAGTLTITPPPIFTSVDALKTYLQDRPANTISSPYTVVLNVSDLTGIAAALTATNVSNKYVSIDLSGSTITTIDQRTFYNNGYGCSSLTSVTISNGVTSIGSRAFYGCTNLTSVTIPNGVTSIGEDAFRGCTRLTSVTIPDSVTSIERGAFCDCESLTSVTIPDGVTSIRQEAFRGCIRLTSVTIPNGVTSIGNLAFWACERLTSVTIPDGVTSIGEDAFESSGLTSVIIPNSVISIGDSAFNLCAGLTAITVNAANTEYSSQDGVLYNKDKTALIQYPSGKTDSTFTIPNSVTSIRQEAFRGCTRLTSVIIPNSVTSIGQFAFCKCTSLTGVTIGNSVTSIGKYAFENCENLASVTIPNSVTSIGEGAFYDCYSLTSVTFNAGSAITSANFQSFVFPEGSFGGGDTLKSAYLSGSGGAGTYTRASTSATTWTKQ